MAAYCTCIDSLCRKKRLIGDEIWLVNVELLSLTYINFETAETAGLKWGKFALEIRHKLVLSSSKSGFQVDVQLFPGSDDGVLFLDFLQVLNSRNKVTSRNDSSGMEAMTSFMSTARRFTGFLAAEF